jgi:hypothetical protein
MPWAHPSSKLRKVVVVEHHLSALLCGMHATFPEHNPSFDPVTQVADRPIQDGGSVIGSQDSVVTTETKLNPAVPVRTHTQAIARSSLSAAPASTTNRTYA